MNNREALSYVIFITNQKIRELERRWQGGDMPEIPKAELNKHIKLRSWAQNKLVEVRVQEYGYD